MQKKSVQKFTLKAEKELKSFFKVLAKSTYKPNFGDASGSSDDDYGEEASEAVKEVKEAENATKIEAAMQSDLSYRFNELNVSYNVDEESKIDLPEAEKTKI